MKTRLLTIRGSVAVTTVLVAGGYLPAHAQNGEDVPFEDTITVTASRPQANVIGDINPDITFNASEIRATGATTVSELLEVLEAETGGSGGRPVILLNGRRISSFNEIRNLPTEAILEVEVLPAEVALKYGYRADQRVVNFKLRPRFRAITTEARAGSSTEGGNENGEVKMNVLRLGEDTRWTIDLEYDAAAALYENERDIEERVTGRPFDRIGNIEGLGAGGEIDPALSALAGELVTVAGVPESGVSGIGDFVSTANSPNFTDIREYRALRPETETIAAGLSYFHPFTQSVAGTVSTRLEFSTTDRPRGLAPVNLVLPNGNAYNPFSDAVRLVRYGDSLRTERDELNGEANFVLNGNHKDWNWSLDGGYSYDDSERVIDRSIDQAALQSQLDADDPDFDPYGPLGGPLENRVQSTQETLSSSLLVSFRSGRLPAGTIQTTILVGAESTDFEATSVIDGADGVVNSLSRDVARARFNIDLPVANAHDEVLSKLGRLSTNFNAEVEDYSDSGQVSTLGAGFTWRPNDKVRIQYSYTDEERAPTLEQLGNPVTLTNNVRVYDFAAGTTVQVTERDGGNALLRPSNRRITRLGLSLEPFEREGTSVRVNANYTATTTYDDASNFPALTPQIEAAFPERFERDVDGNLLLVDTTPINFAQREREEIRWGINFRKSLKPPQLSEEDRQKLRELLSRNARRSGEEGAPQAGTGRPSGRGRGRGGRGGGNLSLSVYHTYMLEESILIEEGVDPLDLLDGAALGNNGGVPEHKVQARLNYYNGGVGARLNYNWESGTTVEAMPFRQNNQLDSVLEFSSLAQVDTAVYIDPMVRPLMIARYPWLRGTRITLSVDNVFDEKRDVRDENGDVPTAYQPDILDPVGRSYFVSIRKLFPQR